MNRIDAAVGVAHAELRSVLDLFCRRKAREGRNITMSVSSMTILWYSSKAHARIFVEVYANSPNLMKAVISTVVFPFDSTTSMFIRSASL